MRTRISGYLGVSGFKKSGLMLLAVLALSVLVAGTAMAAPGDPDLTFHADGMVTTDFNSVGETANSVAIQPKDGKIIAAGHSWNGTNQDFALARYHPNGTLDTDFHADGMVTTDFNGKDDFVYDVAVQSDGKIVVAGNAYDDPINTSNRDFALARYHPNGTLDTDFHGDGVVTTDFGNGRVHVGESAYSVAIQSDGRIVAAGYTGTATSTTSNTRNDFALARYNPNGSLDMGFDTDGKATADVFGKDNSAYGVAIQPKDGRIVAAGYTGTDATGYDFAIARFGADGTLDADFGAGGPDGDGRATADFFGDDNLARSLALQSDGKIVLGGYAYNGSDKDFAIARFGADGTLDAGFGAGGPDGDGRATADFFKNIDELYDIVLQPDGKIVAAGSAYEITESPNHHFALARFDADGAPDAGFGTVGKVTTEFDKVATEFADDDEEARGLAIQPDGKIVAAGYAYDRTTSNDFALVRYAGGNTDSTAPRVTTATPSGTAVKRNTPLTATFSEAMKKTTINRSTFKLFKCPSTTSKSCTTQITNVTVSPSSDGLRATLNPYGTSSTLLSSRTKYKAVVTTGTKDLAGNALDQNPTTTGNQQKAWYFTTGS